MDESNYIIPQSDTVVRIHLTWILASSLWLIRKISSAGNLSTTLAHASEDLPQIVQVLGGTAQRGDTDLQPREEDRQHIWQGCLRMMPSLSQAKVYPQNRMHRECNNLYKFPVLHVH